MVSTESPPPPPPPPPPRPEGTSEPQPEAGALTEDRKHRSFWKELPVLVVVAFVVALVIKTFLLQAFYIPSASMEPTLREGDRVLVEKISYRFGEPERGDVVVFERDVPGLIGPEEDDNLLEDITEAFKGLFGFPTGTAQDFIKRIVAVGGDTIEGRDGRVFVNGEQVEEPYLFEGQDIAAFGPVEVPEGQIFVMGDNRSNSDDSRNFGPIDADLVVGRAFLLIWPPDDFATL